MLWYYLRISVHITKGNQTILACNCQKDPKNL